MRKRAPFTAWIEELVSRRGVAPEREVNAGIRAGIGMMIRSGACLVGDVASRGWATAALIRSGLRAVVFHEVLGFDPATAAARLGQLRERVEGAPSAETVVHGVSPHAVYSVSPRLMEAAAVYAHKRKIPIAIHLCETPEETDFSRKGAGPLRGLLEAFGVYRPGEHPGVTPVNAVDRAGALSGSLLIHMNHPSRGDLALLARKGARVAVCPNSNRWFGRNEKHPLQKLLQRGVTVGLGTDSLASNTGLDMRAEARTLMKTHPELGPAGVFRLATEGGARALGFSAPHGTLRPGAPFDAVAQGIKLSRRADPLLAIMNARGDVSRVWIDGREIFRGRRQ